MIETQDPKFLVRIPLGVLRELVPTTVEKFIVEGTEYAELRLPVELVLDADVGYMLVEDKEVE